EEAGRVLRGAFEADDDPVTLGRRLEAALGAGRDAWPLPAVRALWDVLWALPRARGAMAEPRRLSPAARVRRPRRRAARRPALARPRRRPPPSARGPVPRGVVEPLEA